MTDIPNQSHDEFPYYASSSGNTRAKRPRLANSFSQSVVGISLTHLQKSPSTMAPRTRFCGTLAAEIGRALPTEPFKLPPHQTCLKCGAKKFAYESKIFCCGDGNIRLASNDYPPELLRLFTSEDEDAQHFRKYARLYNNLFAFSSLGGKFDAQTHKGIYVFKLYGQIYHYVPDLLPNSDNPKYLQLYFCDQVQESTDPNMSPGQLLKIMQAVDKIKTPMTPIIMKVAVEYAGKVNPGTP